MKMVFTIVEFLPTSLKLSTPQKYRKISRKAGYNKPAFTIVELLVVIVVIAILAAITIVSFTGISQKAVATSLQSDLSNAKKQLALYYVEYGSYPTSINTSGDNCPPSADTKYCLKPSSGNTFTYEVNNSINPQTFSLFITNNHIIYNISNNSNPVKAIATGGMVTIDGAYTVHKFLSSGTFTVPNGVSVTGEVLVVGGEAEVEVVLVEVVVEEKF